MSYCRVIFALMVLVMGGVQGIAAQGIYDAILNQDYAAVGAVLDSGVSPNAYNDSGLTPLHAAARQNSVQIIQLLISRGAEVNIQSRTRAGGGQTPLHIAASLGNRQAVDRLIRNGADPNIQDDDGDTALHNAVVSNDTRIIRNLISSGAETELKNNRGQIASDISESADVLQALGSALTVVEQRDIGIVLFASGLALNILPLAMGLPIIAATTGEGIGAGIGAGIFTQLILGQVGVMALASIPFFAFGPLTGTIASAVIILTTATVFAFAPIDVNINRVQVTEAQKVYGAMFAASIGGLAIWIAGAVLWATGDERITARGIVLNDKDEAFGIALNGTQLTVSY